jgi:general secretion pathway protein A
VWDKVNKRGEAMYCKHFGFTQKPFDVTPDHRFLYQTPSHREALASILYGIHERRGFVALVGEAGTGKTTLLRSVLNRLDKNTHSAFIFNSDLPFIQVMALILDELGILNLKSVRRLLLIEAVHRLNDYAIKHFAEGGNVVIIVDEAQNFDPKTIEGLRLLSNLESEERKIIQVILSGQPELDRKLSERAMQQFAQRISLRRAISVLNEKQVFEYIQHRLSIAGDKDSTLFSKNALNLIWQASKGIPRKINILCDNALLNAYGTGQKKIKSIAVKEAIDDLSFHDSVKASKTTSIRERFRLIENKAFIL